MQSLEALAREAAALTDGMPTIDVSDAARMLRICNACRYCEGYCAVFPAMTRRLEFSQVDVHYLANLCHNCGACLHACQYAPPHEFGVNLPRAMARVRVQTYVEHAWPAALGSLYRRNGLAVTLGLVAALTVLLALATASQGMLWQAQPAGNFYRVFPHGWMVGLFAPVFAFVVLALSLSVRRFFRGMHAGPPSAAAAGEAARDALTLKYLDGGQGQGCNEADDAFTLARRRAHHFTFYGFALCFAATCVATLYHYLLGQPAPYGWLSLPKLLGVSGGAAMVIGTVGLWRLNLARHALHGDAAQRPMDRGFIALLFVTAASGLALAAARQTPALALLLSLHLASVMALFVTMPYGKFVHGVYRAAALVLWSLEKRRPKQLDAGEA